MSKFIVPCSGDKRMVPSLAYLDSFFDWLVIVDLSVSEVGLPSTKRQRAGRVDWMFTDVDTSWDAIDLGPTFCFSCLCGCNAAPVWVGNAVVLFCAQRQYKLYLSCIPCLCHVLHAMP